jgi:hypothetical protein
MPDKNEIQAEIDRITQLVVDLTNEIKLLSQHHRRMREQAYFDTLVMDEPDDLT